MNKQTFFSRSHSKNQIWLSPFNVGKEKDNANLLDVTSHLPSSLINAPILRICWSLPKNQICSQEMISADTVTSNGSLDNSVTDYVLCDLLNEEKTCEKCMMPLTSHMTNFISKEGILRFVTKKIEDPNLSLGNDEVIWKWEQPKAKIQSRRLEVEGTPTRTKVLRKHYGTISFKLFVRVLLHRRSEMLHYFGNGDWTCCYWYEMEQVYSLSPHKTFVTDGNPNFQAEEPGSGISPVLLKYSSFGSENIWTAVGIDLHSHSSGDLPISDDYLGKFLSAALHFLDGNEIENASETHQRVSSELCGNGFEFSVTCHHAREFRHLRSTLALQEADYIQTLQQCKRWNAQGGKSKVIFMKTADERLILKEIQTIEFTMLDKNAPKYFDHFEKCAASNTPSCLVKILGLHLVRRRVGSKITTTKLIVMQNLMDGYDNHVSYDLKGLRYSRYVSNKNTAVLQDANYMEQMPFSANFLSQEDKIALENSLRRDTSFLRDFKIMDYSMLVVFNREEKVVTIGIIDYLRRYTFDKEMESAFKTFFRRHPPTVVPPEEYQERFMKSVTDYFPVIPI